ncbi:MAG: hypothetical protein PHP03_00785 [Candidatus Pacebacteria bacterium]|nr:hypothetical protein [Candidatus Paceibacterota bacterium]
MENISEVDITPEELQEFKRIYVEVFKKEISDTEALKMAINVVNFFALTCELVSVKDVEPSTK